LHPPRSLCNAEGCAGQSSAGCVVTACRWSGHAVTLDLLGVYQNTVESAP
jgi:hypothetical protein